MSREFHYRIRQISVLVIEDDELAEIHTSVLLKEIGVTRITVAKNGNEAIALFKRSRAAFNVILSDWIMPGVTGIDVLKYARDNNIAGKFLLMSGKPTPEFVRSARRADADAFLVKPLTRDQLSSKLAAVMGLRLR